MKSRRITIVRVLVFLAIASCTSSGTAIAQSPTGLSQYVNPFIGTAPLNDPRILGYTLPTGWRSWAGLVFPGSSLPNAMVQLSPITEYGSGAGYEYEDTLIYGFTHTNKGHWNLCNIPLLPVSKPGLINGKYASRFSHQNEDCVAGFLSGVSRRLQSQRKPHLNLAVRLSQV